MDGVVRSISRKLNRNGSRRLDEEEELQCDQSPSIPDSRPPIPCRPELDTHFQEFCMTVQAMAGGLKIQEQFLLGVWTGADRDINRALNHFLEMQDGEIPREVADDVAPNADMADVPPIPSNGTSDPWGTAAARADAPAVFASLRSCVYCGIGGVLILSGIPREDRTLSHAVHSLRDIIPGAARFAMHSLRDIPGAAHFAMRGIIVGPTHLAVQSLRILFSGLCSKVGLFTLTGAISWMIYRSKKGNGRELFIDVIEDLDLSGTEEPALVRCKIVTVTSFPCPMPAKLSMKIPRAATITNPTCCLTSEPGVHGIYSFEFHCPMGNSERWGGVGDIAIPFECDISTRERTPFEISMDGSQEKGWTITVKSMYDSLVEADYVVTKVGSGDMGGALQKPAAGSGRVSMIQSGGGECKVCEWKLGSLSGGKVCTLHFPPASATPTEATVNFEIPQYNYSGIRIRYCKVSLPSAPPVKWIRYLSKGCISRQFA